MRRPESMAEAGIRAARWSAGPGGLAALFVAGAVIRLVLAPGGGFPYDIGTFSAWADRLAANGPSGFYADPQYFVDYPPGYLYVLWGLGKLSRVLLASAPTAFVLKLPGIAADLGLAWVVVVLTRRLTPAGVERRVPWEGVAAAAILLNPSVIYVSAVWGQVDSVHALIVLCAVVLLGTGEPTVRREAAGLSVLVLAFLTKPQAIFVFPAAGLVLLWRHVRAAFAEERGWREAWYALARVAGLGVVAIGFGLVVLAPFGLGPAGLVRFYSKAASTYPYTSVWAFNLWGAVGFWRRDVSGDGVVGLFGVPALWLALGAFVAVAVAVTVLAWRALARGEDEGRVLLFGGAALTLVGFALLTRVHERYLFLALACLAPLVAYRRAGRALLGLSVLYLLNVYFAFAYYIDFVDRKTFKIGWLFDLVYGRSQDSTQKKIISFLTGALCLYVAWAGWRWLRERRVPGVAVSQLEAGPSAVQVSLPMDLPEPVPADARGRRFALVLHPVGVPGSVAAVAVFAFVLLTRLAGLGTPHGMYFDEVYHARTGGEYLQRKEAYEWTHPPLAKELIALSIARTSGFGVRSGSLPERVNGALVSSDGRDVVFAGRAGPAAGRLHTGRFEDGCGIRVAGAQTALRVSPTAVAAAPGGAVVGGTDRTGPALTRIRDGRELWHTRLPDEPKQVIFLGQGAFVMTQGGAVYRTSAEGVATLVAEGASAIAGSSRNEHAWVSFASQHKVVSYAEDGAVRAEVSIGGEPVALAVVDDADRVLAVDRTQTLIEAIDTESKARTDELRGSRPTAFAVVPETGLVWASAGRSLELIEPRGMSVLGRLALDTTPAALLPSPDRIGVLAPSGARLSCASGTPQYAWRLGSAIFGAAIAAFTVLLALRAFGSMLTALLAGAFVAFDGLAFVMSRIAMNDSYVTAFILAAWFAALSAFFHWGARADSERRSRRAALIWLAGTGLFAGLAISSKWVGLYALGGIVLLLAYDLWTRGPDGLWGILPHPLLTLGAIGVALVAIPAVVYVVSYIPYFALGHNLADLVRLQKGMYDYHSKLTAGHPYGSPWYGWPIGRRAVWLYLGSRGDLRAEIWTAANPVVFLGGLVGMVTLAYQGVRRRSTTLFLAPLAAAVQYLPWLTVRRVTFLYHYLPVVPFLAIALAWWIGVGRKGVPKGQRIAEIVAVAGAAVVVFILILPVIDGWFVSEDYLRAVKTWLGWMFATQG